MDPKENINTPPVGMGQNPVVPDGLEPTPVQETPEPTIGVNEAMNSTESNSIPVSFGTTPTEEPNLNGPVVADNSQPNVTGDTSNMVGGSEESAEPEAESEPEPEPIEPAAPLPGSIGSAMSGDSMAAATPPAETPVMEANNVPTSDLNTPENAPTGIANNPTTQMNPVPEKPKKKIQTTTIVLIALAAIAIVASVVALVLAFSGNKPKETTTTTTSVEVTKKEPKESSLVCSADSASSEAPMEYPGLVSYKRELKAKYLDDELDTISSKDVFTFDSAENANNFSTVQQAEYTNTYTSLGLTADPFGSKFNVSEAIVSIARTAALDDLNVENMAIFSLQSDDGEEVSTSASSIKKIYESLGFKCTTGETEEDEEIEE